MSDSPTRPRRRQLLLAGLALGGAAAVGGGGWAIWRWRRFKALDPGARKLAWLLAGKAAALDLDLNDEIVALWIADHQRFHGAVDEGKARASRKLVQSLILSSNTLTRGDDPLAYLSYYDPHKNPCYNPLRDYSREIA